MTVPGLLVLLAQRPPFFAHVEEILRRPADSVVGWRACTCRSTLSHHRSDVTRLHHEEVVESDFAALRLTRTAVFYTTSVLRSRTVIQRRSTAPAKRGSPHNTPGVSCQHDN